jgi:hypothetical protein
VFLPLDNRDVKPDRRAGVLGGDHVMILIERDGKTVVITGWRAWLLAAVAVVVTTAVLAALAFLVLGIAVTMIAFLLIVMPAVARGAGGVVFPTAKIDAGPWFPA